MKFIHFQIPVVDNQITMSAQEVDELSIKIRKMLPSDVEFICTPFNITWNDKIVEVGGFKDLDISDYTKEAFVSFIKERFKEKKVKYQILKG